MSPTSDEKYVKTTFKIDTELFWEIKRLAVDQRTNITPLVNEALSDLLGKYKKRSKN